VKTSLDYFLSGRSLPAWITGLAFVSANLGATEILGNGANGAQYGIATVNYSWIGAIPAMVFLGLVMMPFYYGSKVRSVPEYLLKRFDQKSHIFNALTFALATVLIAGVNLFALALVLQLLLGWPIILGIVVAAGIVLAYITLGGLCSAIYNEVLQFFVILAALIPLTIVGLHDSGGWSGLKDHVRDSKLGEAGRGCTRCRARASATWSTRSARRGSGSSSASASCSRSATGRRTSPRSSAASRPPSAPR
jgi:SSS family solute:Na+ symporter